MYPLEPSIVHTTILHHPARPASCLQLTLDTVRKATKLPHRVELVVQGPPTDAEWADRIPEPFEEDDFQLEITYREKNDRIGIPLKTSFECGMMLGAKWLAKVDDDMEIPEGAYDTMIRCAESEDGMEEFITGAVSLQNESVRATCIKKKRLHGGQYVFETKKNWPRARRKNQLDQWIVSDVIGASCSLYRREIFDKGCMWDQKLHVLEDFDISLQMKEKGFSPLICMSQHAIHHKKRCVNAAYRSDRRRVAWLKESAMRFQEKWGAIPESLRDWIVKWRV